jgi:flagellar hook-associated protein 3 FlgL
MTVNSATIGADWFLNGLANLQSQELQTQKQLSSGYAVSSAADDPAATQDLVDLGSSLAATQAYQSNLGNVQTEASAADTALGSAITLIQSAQSLATQGATSTATASQQQDLALQVQAIQQQIVGLANTTVAGRYIFGGDDDQSPPYQYDASSPTGVDLLTAAPSTRTIVNPAGETVYQSLTAGAIFDPQTTGVPTAGPGGDTSPAANNTFAALQNLETALSTNNTAGVGTALSSLESASQLLNQQQAYYGVSERRLTSEQNSVATKITQIQTSIGSIRDANVAQDATDLTQESTDQQAAMAAQAEIPQKSLFDYLA